LASRTPATDSATEPPDHEERQAAFVTEKRGVFYAVIYEGRNPISGRERRRWHRCGTASQRRSSLPTSPKAAPFNAVPARRWPSPSTSSGNGYPPRKRRSPHPPMPATSPRSSTTCSPTSATRRCGDSRPSTS